LSALPSLLGLLLALVFVTVQCRDMSDSRRTLSDILLAGMISFDKLVNYQLSVDIRRHFRCCSIIICNRFYACIAAFLIKQNSDGDLSANSRLVGELLMPDQS
jgi:hypothetical protein